ncbi:polyketide cyclase [Winogradskya consettensis]|uniref:Polyketide cyclase n=1 Tax=Winogradskya consettensis TaxID=113560 RepID=A0A919S5Z7_9ACTN|nr:polyketide cyclase [Actinoplanes consettensis]
MAWAGMPPLVANVQRIVPARPDQVFAVLADGWTYSDWVVGTAHIRDVDASWPQKGAKLHHKAGPWPVSLHDSSEVLAVVPDRSLKLRAGLWPAGEATITFELEPAGPASTKITMIEEFHAGPLNWIHNKLNDLILHRRNIESLRRLSDIATRSDVATRAEGHS